MKSGDDLFRGDKHFEEIFKGVLCLWRFYRNDLEPLVGGARHHEKRRRLV